MTADRGRQRRTGEAREEILGRLETAYRAAGEGGGPAGRIAYALEPGRDPEMLLAVARERFESQEIGYHILPGFQSLVDSVANHLYSRQARLVALQPCGLFDRLDLRHGLARRLPDLRFVDAGSGLTDVARADVGITACEAVIAQTGTIVLSATKREELGVSLLGGVHFCIATVDQLTADLDSWLAGRPGWAPDEATVLISGPSRTADIEKTVVIGVHGPWKLSLFLVKE